jgi:hypothetical protein
MLFFVPPPVTPVYISLSSQAQAAETQPAQSPTIPVVPFYSQFADIQSPKWQRVGCGVTSLAMVIDFYKPDALSVNTLLKQGIAAGAYDPNDGWITSGLIQLAKQYGLTGTRYDLSQLDTPTALAQLERFLNDGPVILSVHYKFDPKSTIPHLVVINAISHGVAYYNDPAAKAGGQQISIADLLRGWKKTILVIRPANGDGAKALTLK